MSKTVEFYFDLGSPATYLAYTQLPKICEQTDSQLIYVPILLGGVFKACLLYTSPSPRDGLLSRMPSSA